MTYLLPTDKLTHYLIGTLCALALLPADPLWAGLACLAAAIGREGYGWRRRDWAPFVGADWIESAQDIGATLAGGAVVLAAAFIGAGP